MELDDEGENLYEQIKYGGIRKSSNLIDESYAAPSSTCISPERCKQKSKGYTYCHDLNNIIVLIFKPSCALATSLLAWSLLQYLFVSTGSCVVGSPLDIHFVNSIPCVSDNDGYLISKSKLTTGNINLI